uniref:Uncharacterized protein n=1 Tax=Anguilla anguilla TaxID=7936 RepID=A0A0E9PSG7_ANGAN
MSSDGQKTFPANVRHLSTNGCQIHQKKCLPLKDPVTMGTSGLQFPLVFGAKFSAGRRHHTYTHTKLSSFSSTLKDYIEFQ